MLLQQQTYVKRLDDSSTPAGSMAPAVGQSKAGELLSETFYTSMTTVWLFAVDSSYVLVWCAFPGEHREIGCLSSRLLCQHTPDCP